MERLGEQLRRAREAQGMSIEQIEEITLINARHLEAIERGALNTLPRPYIRAFVREYASAVGLDPADVLKGFDDREAERVRQTAAPLQVADHEPVVPRGEPVATRVLGSSAVRIALVGSVLVLGSIALVFLNERSTAPAVREIPFTTVVKESEARLAPREQAAPAAAPAATDSLTLAVVVTDTLWMQVTVDDGTIREYLAPPGVRLSWKARDRFVVTIGNLQAATWTLNGSRLGALRKTGTVARNVELNRTTLAGL